ncbi:hypothetical protein SADUNF_Sadunf10G0113000 [Salix dunnii]|uniref:ER membrane protein complex subunit 6 n=1 Tax=Salix dunnii TaxID=1413687 RepID=A0A835MRX3_9ROSI|nr:hypothetical protein SADUNF_Sadunf10G0113000 [Salix dunnii]
MSRRSKRGAFAVVVLLPVDKAAAFREQNKKDWKLKSKTRRKFTEVTAYIAYKDLSDFLKVEAMAGHGESERKSSDAVNDLQTFRAENLQSNMKVIYYSRTFLSIIGGVIAGILGFTGLTGFVFYFLMMAITSVALIAKAKFSIHTYFDSWNRVLLDGFLGGLMSFVLFWTYPLH